MVHHLWSDTVHVILKFSNLRIQMVWCPYLFAYFDVCRVCISHTVTVTAHCSEYYPWFKMWVHPCKGHSFLMYCLLHLIGLCQSCLCHYDSQISTNVYANPFSLSEPSRFVSVVQIDRCSGIKEISVPPSACCSPGPEKRNLYTSTWYTNFKMIQPMSF